ncbi:MAG: DNA topoisomerase IB [Actinobacteria bacterium]|nr:DNA topoisomerase IB [Actinomycetota bacterium]
MPRLRKVDCSGAGISRRRRGRGFEYVYPDGRKVTEQLVLDRIRDLVIPPAWGDVWVCSSDNGHLQATGIDAAGRRQYIYHQRWTARREQEKFDHMVEFAGSLPLIRKRCSSHLQNRDMDMDRVLAAAVRLLDRGLFRIGTEGYAEQNQTFGLATIEKRHVKLESNDAISFDYVGKSGQRRLTSIVDADVYAVVEILKKRRGTKRLLAYEDDSGRWVPIRSADINAYIKRIAGNDFTAKDFRTWAATVLAAIALAVSAEASRTPRSRKLAISRAVKEVSEYLGNTPAVCRSSYIDPRVFDRYNSGFTIAGALESLGDIEVIGEPSFQGTVEEAVLDLVRGSKSDPVEKIA